MKVMRNSMKECSHLTDPFVHFGILVQLRHFSGRQFQHPNFALLVCNCSLDKVDVFLG